MRTRFELVIVLLFSASIARAESDDKDELLAKDPTRAAAVSVGEAGVDGRRLLSVGSAALRRTHGVAQRSLRIRTATRDLT
jgi:hypothetical protein